MAYRSLCKPQELASLCLLIFATASDQYIRVSVNNYLILPFFDGNWSPNKTQERQKAPSKLGEYFSHENCSSHSKQKLLLFVLGKRKDFQGLKTFLIKSWI